MIPEKYLDLISKLTEKTQQRQIIWQRSSTQGEFKLQLSSSILTVDKYEGDYNNSPSVTINIYNDKGEKIDIIDIEATTQQFALADEFYSSIRRSYYKVDETINALFDELKTDKIIGVPENEEDNDLPF